MKYRSLRSLWWVIKLQLKTSKTYFGWSLIYSIYDGASSILNTFVVAKLITSVTAVTFQRGTSAEVYQWLGLLLVVEIIDVILRNINTLTSSRFQQEVYLAATEQFYGKMYELSQEQFDNEAFNTKLGRAKDSLNQTWRVLNELSWSLSSLVRFVGAIGAVVVVAPIIGAVIMVMIIPVSLLRIKQNKMREETYRKVEPYDRVSFRSGWMLLDPATMPEIRLMNAFRDLISSWRINHKKTVDMTYETEKKVTIIDVTTETVQPIIEFLANVHLFRLLVAGSLGLDRFIFLRGILAQASNSATSLATSFERLHELSINLRNFSEVNDTLPAITNGKVMVQRPLTIEFKNVSFAYPGTDELILKDVSFLIVPGSKLALVGENGAGKTTLIKLLLRQYIPTSGTITINGTDIQDIEQESYYRVLSNLSQDFLVVEHLTVRDNLRIGLHHNVTDKEILTVTDLVGATAFIEKLPHKLDQRLDASFDDGTGLSGGQTQRLGVARALLRNGDIMILDEPTSAIDAKAEYMIFNNIYQAHAGKTTLIVSHRFSTVRKADKIIVMENGRITEYGSHEELLEHGGLYKEMFEAQAEGYK